MFDKKLKLLLKPLERATEWESREAWEEKVIRGYLLQLDKKISNYIKNTDDTPESRRALVIMFEAVSDIQKKLREAQ